MTMYRNVNALHEWNLKAAANNNVWEGKRGEMLAFIKDWGLRNRRLDELAEDFFSSFSHPSCL